MSRKFICALPALLALALVCVATEPSYADRPCKNGQPHLR
jgi:hypothetical protein